MIDLENPTDDERLFKRLIDAINAKDKLLACYRCGKMPSEALYKKLDQAAITLKEVQHRLDYPGKYFVHRNDAGVVFVKESSFFEKQGGLTEPWGRDWKPLRAHSIDAARRLGEKLLP